MSGSAEVDPMAVISELKSALGEAHLQLAILKVRVRDLEAEAQLRENSKQA